MTVPLSTRQDIREMDAAGVPRVEIARRLDVSRNTVAKYADEEDMSPAAPVPEARPHPATDAHAEWIASVLEADPGAPRKQRHTARRIYDRLVAERGYSGSYSSVCRFVAGWRRDRAAASGSGGYLELVWAPGTAQVDFGNFRCVVGGRALDAKLLVVALPHSNARCCTAMTSERSECLCDGLREVFEWIGRAPSALVLDNATEAGRMVRGEVTESRLFSQFRMHYRCASRYCNPLLRQREGLGRERGRVPAAQPPGARAARLDDVRAQRRPARRLRPDQRRLVEPRRRPDARGARRGPRGHAGPARRPVRRREVGRGQGGQVRRRGGGRVPLRGGARVARPQAARGHAPLLGRAGGRRGPARRLAAEGAGRRRDRARPRLAHTGARGQAEGVRGVGDPRGHAGGARRRGRPLRQGGAPAGAAGGIAGGRRLRVRRGLRGRREDLLGRQGPRRRLLRRAGPQDRGGLGQRRAGVPVRLQRLHGRGGGRGCRLARGRPPASWPRGRRARSPRRCSPNGRAGARRSRSSTWPSTWRPSAPAATPPRGRRSCAGAPCPPRRPSTATTGRRRPGRTGSGATTCCRCRSWRASRTWCSWATSEPARPTWRRRCARWPARASWRRGSSRPRRW